MPLVIFPVVTLTIDAFIAFVTFKLVNVPTEVIDDVLTAYATLVPNVPLAVTSAFAEAVLLNVRFPAAKTNPLFEYAATVFAATFAAA